MGDELGQLDWLDRKLREEAPYIDDAGFTAKVMQTLPERPATRSLRGLILLFSAILASTGAYVLSGGGRFVYEAFACAQLFSTPVIILFTALVGLCLTGISALAALRRAESV
jgi:hypothetical protein